MNFKATSKIRGDETQSFDVTDYKATTVGEFVDEVLSGNGKDEWGYFEFIRVKPQKVGNWNIPPEWDRYEYKRGSLLDKIPDTLRNKRIEHVTGDGGWSRMDYDITVVEENDYCKQNCKGYRDTGGKCFVDDCQEKENVVRIGDRVFVDGTEVFKNIKGITYNTSGVSINEDAKTPTEKAIEIAKKTHVIYDDYYDSIQECIESAMQMHEWDKQQFIEKACEFWGHKFPYIDIDIIKEFVDIMKGE